MDLILVIFHIAVEVKGKHTKVSLGSIYKKKRLENSNLL